MVILICHCPKIKQKKKKVAMPLPIIDLHQLKDALSDVSVTTMKNNSSKQSQ